MNFIQTLIFEDDDLSRLPKDVMSAIRSNIRKGAENLEQQWANALELVHKAYEVEGVERPTPDMETAWEQYQENLRYAVKELADNRGMDGDWRMSSSMFHENHSFIVQEPTGEIHVVEAISINDVINKIKNQSQYDVLVERVDSDTAQIRFSRWNIKKPGTVVITKTPEA